MIKDNQKNKSLSWKGKWPLFLIANLAILLVIGISTARESYRSWTVDKEAELEQMIAEHDLVVSLLPYTYHVMVAKKAIKHKKNMSCSRLEYIQEHGFNAKVAHERTVKCGQIIAVTDLIPEHISRVLYSIKSGFIICNIQEWCFQVNIVYQPVGS